MPIENIKLYLDKAKEMSKLPDEETDVLSLGMYAQRGDRRFFAGDL